MTHEKALKLLAECVSHATSDFPAMTEEYWAALRMMPQRKSEWISVKDRLPEKGKSVLVYWDDGFEIGEYVGGEVGEDIYWMPLPEPPKEELK